MAYGYGFRRWLQEMASGGDFRDGFRRWLQEMPSGDGFKGWLQGVASGGGFRAGFGGRWEAFGRHLGDRLPR